MIQSGIKENTKLRRDSPSNGVGNKNRKEEKKREEIGNSLLSSSNRWIGCLL
jgi:hypothetical protein